MTIIDRSLFILGLGISGMSLAKKLNFRNIYCWDDNSTIRGLAKNQQINIKEPNLKNLRHTDFLVLSSGINHELKSPHNAITTGFRSSIQQIRQQLTQFAECRHRPYPTTAIAP